MRNLKERYLDFVKNLAKQALLAKRENVNLLAVSKGHSASAIEELYSLGQRDFGESYVQEFLLKKEELRESCPDIRWHFIGRLQSNKLKHLVNCAMVHSLASEKHAIRLSSFENKIPISVFLQVNLDADPLRAGFSEENLLLSIDSLISIEGIKIIGLMVILPQNSKRSSADWFSKVADLKKKLEPKFSYALELSMGMSSDYGDAIRSGSNWIRVGSEIFGKRK